MSPDFPVFRLHLSLVADHPDELSPVIKLYQQILSELTFVEVNSLDCCLNHFQLLLVFLASKVVDC